MIKIDALTLQALVDRAGREAPQSPAEKRAEQDARELLSDDFAAQFPVDGNFCQPTLFDPTPYEVPDR